MDMLIHVKCKTIQCIIIFSAYGYTCNPRNGCVPFLGHNSSSVEVVQIRNNSSWFDSVRACENHGGRLIWLNDKNFSTFLTREISSLVSRFCHNCTFMWLGLMQSTFNDDNFFWKRTLNGNYSAKTS